MYRVSNREYKNNPDYSLPLEKLIAPEIFNQPDDIFIPAADKIYFRSNENLDGIFKNLKLKGKRVATVGSSGDQALFSIFKGASDVTIIDANMYTEPFVSLKMAAIKEFNYEDFKKFNNPDNMFNEKVYAKISHNLTDNAKLFWDSIMLEKDIFPDTLLRRRLFQFDNLKNVFYKYMCNERNYNILKSNLSKCHINFVCEELNNFPTALKGNYDLIMLSNVMDYVNKKDFRRTVEELNRNNLNYGGKIQVYYNFDASNHKVFMDEFKDYIKTKKCKKTIMPALEYLWVLDPNTKSANFFMEKL